MRSPIAVWMPPISPPPPTGTITASASGASSSISSPTVPGAGDHERVVERMDERPAGLLDQRREPVERVARTGRLEVDGCAVAARRRDLLLGRALPHDDERVDVLLGGGAGDGLRVVAGADRDHAARASRRR